MIRRGKAVLFFVAGWVLYHCLIKPIFWQQRRAALQRQADDAVFLRIQPPHRFLSHPQEYFRGCRKFAVDPLRHRGAASQGVLHGRN